MPTDPTLLNHGFMGLRVLMTIYMQHFATGTIGDQQREKYFVPKTLREIRKSRRGNLECSLIAY